MRIGSTISLVKISLYLKASISHLYHFIGQNILVLKSKLFINVNLHFQYQGLFFYLSTARTNIIAYLANKRLENRLLTNSVMTIILTPFKISLIYKSNISGDAKYLCLTLHLYLT